MVSIGRKTKATRSTFTRRAFVAGCAAALCLGLTLPMAGCGSDGAKSEDAPAAQSAKDEAATRTFTDSVGRTVEIPAQIDRVAPSGHTATQVLLTMAPDKLVGISQELDDSLAKYVGQEYADLPVFGAAFGSKGDLNKEAVAAAGAQILIDTGEIKDGIAEDLDALQEQLGIPCVFIETKLEDYGAAYEMLGELLGMEDRGQELAHYCRAAYDETQQVMAGIPESERANVAYLLGDAGTNAIAKDSYQGQVLDMVANNVAVIVEPSGKGTGNEVSLEQIALWNPEIILFQKGSIYDTVADDPAWAGIAAVKSGQVYEVPNEPWCWLNNPPTINQVMGMQWLPRLLYPDAYDDDLYETVAACYQTFYGYDLSQFEFDELMANALPKH